MWYNILMVNAKKSSRASLASRTNSTKTSRSFSRAGSTNRNSARSSTRKNVRRHDGSKPTLNLAQKIILGVIGLLILIVVIFTICAFKFDTKFQVEAKISDLTREYYENYYYPNAFGNDTEISTNFLSRFSDSGLTPVTLRQLLLTLDNVSESDAAFLKKYCDENATSVHYFPEEPYAADSYRSEITYSCNYQ